MKFEKHLSTLIFYFEHEFDNLYVSQNKIECIALIETLQPEKVILDFRNVTYVDSTGIGFVLARFKQCRGMNCKLICANLNHHQYQLFAMSGIFQLIEHEESNYEQNELSV